MCLVVMIMPNMEIERNAEECLLNNHRDAHNIRNNLMLIDINQIGIVAP
jgi:hypothetical protein